MFWFRPVATADACSLTTIVTISSTLRARTSAAISANVAGDDQSDRGSPESAVAARADERPQRIDQGESPVAGNLFLLRSFSAWRKIPEHQRTTGT